MAPTVHSRHPLQHPSRLCPAPPPPPCRAGPSPGGAPPPLQGSDLAGLIEDAYTLAEAGEGGISHFLDLLL